MKAFIISLLITAFSISLYSQKSEKRLAIQGGINSSSLTYDFFSAFSSTSNASSLGFHIGLSNQLKISKSFFLRPTISISQQGDRKTNEYKPMYQMGQEVVIPTRIDYKLDYINLPIDFIYQFKDGLKADHRLFTGLQTGFLLNHNKMSLNVGDPNKFDLGVYLGYETVFNDFFIINLKVYQGILFVLKNSESPLLFYRNKGITNQMIQISVGFYIS